MSETLERLVRNLQAHAKEQGWQDVDEPIADLLAWEAQPTPPAEGDIARTAHLNRGHTIECGADYDTCSCGATVWHTSKRPEGETPEGLSADALTVRRALYATGACGAGALHALDRLTADLAAARAEIQRLQIASKADALADTEARQRERAETTRTILALEQQVDAARAQEEA